MPDNINTDNVRLNEGEGGALVATDLVFYNGVTAHAQYVKIAAGANDEFFPVGTTAGATPLPTTLYTSNGVEMSFSDPTNVGSPALDVNVRSIGGIDTDDSVPVFYDFDEYGYVPVAGSVDGSVPVTIKTDPTFPLDVIVNEVTLPPEIFAEYSLTNFSNGLFGVTGEVISVFNVRGLSAGSSTGSPIDSVSVQGISGGRPVVVQGVSGGVSLNTNITNIDTISLSGATAMRVSQRVLGVPTTGSVLPAGFTGNYGSSYDRVGVQGISGGHPIFSRIVAGGPTGSIPNGYSAIGVSGDALKVTVADAGFTFNVSIGTSVTTFGFTGQPGLSGMPSLLHGASGATWNAIGASGDSLKVSIVSSSVSLGNVTVDNTSLPVTGLAGGAVLVGGTSGTFPVTIKPEGYTAGGSFDIRGITGVINLPTGAATETTLSGIRTDLTGITNSIVHISNINTAFSSGFTSGHFKVKTTPQSSFITGSTQGAPHVIRQLPGFTLSAVKLKAARTNEDPIYILNTASPVGNTADAGYPLSAGEEIFLEIDNLNKVYYYATGEGALYRISYIGS